MIVQVQVGPKIFSFGSMQAWIDGAQRIWRFHGVSAQQTLCLDQLGRVVTCGGHFDQARKDNAYPVDVYLVRQDMKTALADGVDEGGQGG